MLNSNVYKEQRVGILIDVQNMYYSAKNLYNSKVNFVEILNTALRGRKLIRAVAYTIKADVKDEKNFHEALEKIGFEVKTKDLLVFHGGHKKGDWDVGIAMDAVRAAEKVDVIVVVSGDGDFKEMYEYVRGKGCRIEVIAFGKTASSSIKGYVDDFIDMDNGKLYQINNSKWKRWKTSSIKPQPKVRGKIKDGTKEYSLFWADTHCHSNFSPDAEGEVDELIHFARDIAGINAVCIIDNDYYPHKALTEAEWKIHQQFSTHFTKEGEFVVFPGWEYTYHRKDLNPDFNHRCILYPRAGGKIFRRIDRNTNSDEKLFKKLKGTNVMCYPHHCSYKIIDSEVDRNVEVCSSWRVCIEEVNFTVKILQSGEKLGFIGSSDSHRAVPGLGGALTGLFAEKLTPEGLFEAYKNRRTIATQGFFIFIDFKAGDTFIGGEGEISGYPDIKASIKAPREIEFAEVLRDGKPIHKETPKNRECDFRFKDKNTQLGKHFYFLRVKLVGDSSFNIDPAENSLKPHSPDSKYPHNLARARGVFAWTSPVWLRIKRV